MFKTFHDGIQSKYGRLEAFEINKICFSCFDHKINNATQWVLCIRSLRVNYEKPVFLMTVQEDFLLIYKNIISIFGQVRTTCLSSYQAIKVLS